MVPTMLPGFNNGGGGGVQTKSIYSALHRKNDYISNIGVLGLKRTALLCPNEPLAALLALIWRPIDDNV